MVTSAHEFKRTETLTLPSGKTVEARKPNIKRLVLHSPKGEVPEFLTQIVLSGLNGKPVNPLEGIDSMSDDDKLKTLAGLDDFTELIVRTSLVSPRVVKDNPDYDAGEIAFDDLTDEDAAFIATWGMPKDAQAAEAFREGQTSGVALTSDVPTVQPATE